MRQKRVCLYTCMYLRVRSMIYRATLHRINHTVILFYYRIITPSHHTIILSNYHIIPSHHSVILTITLYYHTISIRLFNTRQQQQQQQQQQQW